MNSISSLITNESVLVFVLRVILGILFFFQGYDKIFKIKISGVVDFYKYELGTIRMPNWVLALSAYYTSYIELIGGILLIVGFFKSWALYLLGIDLILVTAAFSMIKPMWDMQLLFPRLIILSILLYLPANWDLLSIDNLFRF
ncbi:MAG: DoxX family protein [Bacteroidetes bacterium]|nr:DoxX family protein [Bacteroidota bacterium]